MRHGTAWGASPSKSWSRGRRPDWGLGGTGGPRQLLGSWDVARVGALLRHRVARCTPALPLRDPEGKEGQLSSWTAAGREAHELSTRVAQCSCNFCHSTGWRVCEHAHASGLSCQANSPYLVSCPLRRCPQDLPACGGHPPTPRRPPPSWPSSWMRAGARRATGSRHRQPHTCGVKRRARHERQ